MMKWENNKNKKVEDFYSDDYERYSKLASKEQQPSFAQKMEEVTRRLDSTLNQCLHDYNFDEVRDLYDVIEGEKTL